MMGKLDEGRNLTGVAQEFGFDNCVISGAWKVFQQTGTVGGGRSRKLIANDDLYVVVQEKRDQNQLAGNIAQLLCMATGRQVSQFTVDRHFHKGGLLLS